MAGNASPVFIVGSPRSGTSVIAGSLLAASYNGFHEGNLFGLIEWLDQTIDRHFTWFGTDDPLVMMSRFDRDEIKNEIHCLLRRLVERENPLAPWFDKSGNSEVIRAVPVLLKLWPSAHFIFAKRRGIENVVSRMIKFPEHDFEYHCRDWAENMSAWHTVRHSIADLKAIEVDQQDIAQTPGTVAAQLASFLALTPRQEIAVARIFRNDRPQQTAEGTADRVLSLESTGWSQSQIDLFLRLCGRQMRRYGYTLDTSYRAETFTLGAAFRHTAAPEVTPWP